MCAYLSGAAVLAYTLFLPGSTGLQKLIVPTLLWHHGCILFVRKCAHHITASRMPKSRGKTKVGEESVAGRCRFL